MTVRYRTAGLSDHSVVKAENSTVKKTVCQFCAQPAQLEVAASPQLAPAWRMFDCPHCHRTNFILLDAHIQSVKTANE